jgi:signal recognition particle subunit SRP54
VAGRILGMGDVVSLVEKAAELVDQDEAEKIARKLAKGGFDMNDLRSQLAQVRKMGGMGGILGKLPGIQKFKAQIQDAKLDDGMVTRQMAIIDSMTKKERRDPKSIDGSRRRRIARGSGTEVQEINKLLKQHRQMQDMMKQMKKAGGMKGLQGMLGRGGMPPGLLPR